METLALTLGIALLIGLGVHMWRRQRTERLPVTHHAVRCPLHDCDADVAVRTDPRAMSTRQYVEVSSCSLLGDAAVALPERSGFLTDFAPYELRLQAATLHPVPDTEVRCPQHCVFLLNEANGCAGPQRRPDMSGASDAMELMRQTDQDPRLGRLVWYYGP